MDRPSESHSDPARADLAAPDGPGVAAASEAATGLFADASAEKIEKADPAIAALRKLMDERIAADDVELPRHPDVASKILNLAQAPNASTRDVIRQVRTDAALCGRLLEIANSATFAGAQRVYSLKGAIVRLGLTRVGEVAFEMARASRNFHTDKRRHMLMRMWKFSLAVAFVAEELAERVPGEAADGAFLTGLFHNVAGPFVLECIGRLERSGAIPVQTDSRALGLVDGLADEYTQRILTAWNVPKPSLEAIRLQNEKTRDRRGKPLANLLVCAKALATELGMGVRACPLDFETCRDFRALGLDSDAKLEPVREAALDKMVQVARS